MSELSRQRNLLQLRYLRQPIERPRTTGTVIAYCWVSNDDFDDFNRKVEKMTVYTKNESQPLKWLVALIVFILAMTITFDDAYGVSVPSGSNVNHRLVQTSGVHNHHTQLHGSAYLLDNRDQLVHVDKDPDNNPPPETVPEPATGLLLALGMGVAAIARKIRK